MVVGNKMTVLSLYVFFSCFETNVHRFKKQTVLFKRRFTSIYCEISHFPL